MTRPLTDRERQILVRVAAGQSNPQIGRELYLSVDTVATHLKRVSAELGARSRTHAVVLAHLRGQIDLNALEAS